MPGASLADYPKILLRPVSISFRRDWGRGGSSIGRVRPEDAQRIRDKLAAVVREETVRELTAGGYQVVEQSGDDVLEVNARITDLYIVSPDVPSTTGVRTYALSAGDMVLVAELRDSSSGELLMRAYDHAYAREHSNMRRISDAENATEARRIATDWAKVLRKQLDAAGAAKAAN